MSAMVDNVVFFVIGFIFGYFVLGEWFCGTVLGCGRNHKYWFDS